MRQAPPHAERAARAPFAMCVAPPDAACIRAGEGRPGVVMRRRCRWLWVVVAWRLVYGLLAAGDVFTAVVAWRLVACARLVARVWRVRGWWRVHGAVVVAFRC